MSRFLIAEQPMESNPRRQMRSQRKPTTHAERYERNALPAVLLTVGVLAGMAWCGYHLWRALAEWLA